MPSLRRTFLLIHAVAFLASGLLAWPGSASATDIPENARPALVLVIQDPWAPVLGVKPGRAVIYQSGDVIFMHGEPVEEYRHARLSAAELREVLARARAALPREGVKSHYTHVSGITDQPTVSLYFDDGNGGIVTSIYGLSCKEPSDGLASLLGDPEQTPRATQASNTPPAITELVRWLCAYHPAGDRPWLARRIEVVISDYSHFKGKAEPWPEGWPDLASPDSVRREHSSSVFLDGARMPELEALMKRIGQNGAVNLHGELVSLYPREPLPGEAIWRDALKRAEPGQE